MDNATAIIIGSGPSLRDVDMSLVATRDSISFNRAYIAFDQWGFPPTYHMAIDPRVIAQNRDDIMHVPCRGVFLLSAACRSPRRLYGCRWELPCREGAGVGEEWDDLFYCGDVAAASVQVLYLMGYSRAVIVGCDQRYDRERPGVTRKGETWTATEDNDADHFRADYYGAGCEYSDPMPEAHVRAWRGVADQAHGKIALVSATPDTPLNEFIPYKPLEDALCT